MRALGQTSYYFGVPKRYMLGRLTSKGERVGKSGVFLCQATNAVTSSNSNPVWHVIFYLFDSQNPSTSIIAGIGDIPVCPSVCPSTQTFSASLPTPTTPVFAVKSTCSAPGRINSSSNKILPCMERDWGSVCLSVCRSA